MCVRMGSVLNVKQEVTALHTEAAVAVVAASSDSLTAS